MVESTKVSAQHTPYIYTYQYQCQYEGNNMSEISGIRYVVDGGRLTLQVLTSATTNTNDNTISFFDSTNTLLDQVTSTPVTGVAVGFVEDWVGTGEYHILITQIGSSDSSAHFHYDAGSDAISSIVIGGTTMTAPSEPTVTPVDAPTQSQKPYRYTQSYKSQNSHNERLVGIGVTKDLAFSDLQAKAKVTGSSASSPTKSLTLTVTQAVSDAPSLGGTGPTADAEINCHRVADDTTIRVIVPDMLLTYKAGGTFFIDVTNADIIAVATAQTDRYGNGGYVALPTSKYLP